jgi:predicted Fe-Mo cluster-binding NifX family protein
MKIAAVTDDGSTISQHFGRATQYLVLTIEKKEIIQRELRDKVGHDQFHRRHESHQPGQPHGMGSGSHRKHQLMSEAIADCEVLLSGGMGMGAYQSMLQLGIKPVITDLREIDQAVKAYLDGTLVERTDRLH